MPKGKPEQVEKKLGLQPILKQVNNYAYRFFNIIIFIVVLVVFALSYQFLLMPKYSAVMSNDELNRKKQEYLDQMSYLIELKELKAVYENIDEDDKAKANTIVSNTNEKEDLFQEMQYLAIRENITLESLDVVPMDPSYTLSNMAGNDKHSALFDKIQVVRTVVNLSDVTYEAFTRVLKTIELNLRIMDVNRVEYDPSSDTAVIELLTYQINN